VGFYGNQQTELFWQAPLNFAIIFMLITTWRENSRMTLTHFDEQGRAHMVDVGHKQETQREAVARGRILMKPETLALIQAGGIKKGDVLAVAQVAGIMAAKRTHELVPMCHPLMLTHVSLSFEPQPAEPPAELAAINISATVRTTGKTGVEMEALTAVSVAGLTIYDMCKAVDRAMRIDAIRLAKKSGGKSGDIILE
jgi:cyclic pyranopterin phosphate synthase